MSDPVLELRFGAGIDEATQDELVEAGQGFAELQNVRQDHRDAVSKRLGYTSLALTRSDATSRSAGHRLLTNGDQICTIDGTYLDVYSETMARSVVRSRVPECTVRLREAPTMGRYAQAEDCVVVNGYVVISQLVQVTASSTLYHGVTVFDETAGGVVAGPTTIDNSASLENVRLASYGNYVFAFSCDTATSEVRAKYLDLTSATTIATGWTAVPSFTVSDYNTGFDCACLTANDRVAIAYGSDGNAANRITVKTLNVSGQVETVNITPGTALGGDDSLGISLAELADTLWLAYFDNLTPHVVGLNPTDIDGTPLASDLALTALVGVTPNSIFVCERSGSGECIVYVHSYDSTSGAAGYAMTAHPVQTSAGAAATDGSSVVVGGAYMISRPFLYGGRVLAHFWSTPTIADSLYDSVLCDCTVDTSIAYLRPVAIALPRGTHFSSNYRRCRTAVTADSTRYVTTALRVQSGPTLAARLVEYNFADPLRWRTTELNGTTCLGGGVTSLFDGTNVFELGFATAPAQPQTNNTSGTGLTLTYGRVYVCTYEHLDADGNLHTSGVSAPSAPISGAQTNKAVTVKTTPLSMTARGDTAEIQRGAIRVVLWGTLDSNQGEAPFYRVGEIANNPNAMHVTFSDTVSDATLAVKPLLYGTGNLPGTDGSSQDHRAPIGWAHVVGYNGMLVGARGRDIGWTAQNIDGEGAWTSPLFADVLEAECTGLATMDGQVYAFTASHIYSSSGDPPNDNATLGGLGPFRKLGHAGGCINARSICQTPAGVVYRSDRGIELLTRGGGVVWIGERVHDTLASYPYVSAAVYDERAGLVRVSLAAAEASGLVSGNGVDLVWDPVNDVWESKDVKYGTSATQASQDACLVTYAGTAGRYAWLSTGGTVYIERLSSDASACLDGSTWATQRAVTPWVHIAGLNGEQFLDQVLLLAKWATGHDITISLAFDFSASYTSTKTFTAAQVAALAREWLVKEIGDNTKSQAVRVKLEDATPSSGSVGSGKGATWCALTFNGQPHRGPKRTTNAQRGGS